MDSTAWDARYAGSELMWSAGPNTFVEQVCAGLPPGSALDLAAGEGRNALWLAGRGWRATAVDFSPVALERARRLAADRLGADHDRLTTVVADLETFVPDDRYDLVLVVYLQVEPGLRRTVLRRAAAALAPDGRLVVVAHHPDNLTEGVGGPQDPTVLYSPQDVVADLDADVDGAQAMSGTDGVPPVVERAERVLRAAAEGRPAVDTLVVVRRP